jgi:hypothetical protein
VNKQCCYNTWYVSFPTLCCQQISRNSSSSNSTPVGGEDNAPPRSMLPHHIPQLPPGCWVQPLRMPRRHVSFVSVRQQELFYWQGGIQNLLAERERETGGGRGRRRGNLSECLALCHRQHSAAQRQRPRLQHTHTHTHTVLGSSRNTARGPPMNAMATLRRRFMPPLKAPTRCARRRWQRRLPLLLLKQRQQPQHREDEPPVAAVAAVPLSAAASPGPLLVWRFLYPPSVSVSPSLSLSLPLSPPVSPPQVCQRLTARSACSTAVSSSAPVHTTRTRVRMCEISTKYYQQSNANALLRNAEHRRIYNKPKSQQQYAFSLLPILPKHAPLKPFRRP